MRGSNFQVLDDDALLLTSDDNDNPLKRRYDTSQSLQARIVSRTSTEIVWQTEVESSHAQDFYASAIVSNDRSHVYWENETRPLP